MDLHAYLNDRTQALGFAAPNNGTPLAVLAALPKGGTDLDAYDDETILAAIGDGPVPAGIALSKPPRKTNVAAGRERPKRNILSSRDRRKPNVSGRTR